MGDFLSQIMAGMGSAGANAGIGAMNSTLPTLATNAMPQMANTALGNGVISFMDTMAPQVAEQGFLSQMGNFGTQAMDLLGNEKFATALQGGKGLFDSITNYNSAGDMKDMMNTQLGMQTDAYNRDKEADEKRQLLNF